MDETMATDETSNQTGKFQLDKLSKISLGYYK